MLRMSPDAFWRLTPAETADRLIAYRAAENRRLMQRAWEIHLLLTPHMSTEGERPTVLSIFDAMPGSFPADIPKSVRDGAPASGHQYPAGMTPEQVAEAERRRNKPRINRAGTQRTPKPVPQAAPQAVSEDEFFG